MAGMKKKVSQKSNKQNGEESDSDETTVTASDISISASDRMEYLQNQNKEERLRLRRGYRHLMEQLTVNKHDLINPESHSLDDALTEANNLNKNVRMPREGALDSATILMISNLARQKVDNLKTDFITFEPIEFSEKLISFIHQGQSRNSDDLQISRRGWISLGAASQKFFQKSPAFHFMVGSFERGDPKKKVRKNLDGPRGEKENLSDKATIPKQMKSFDESEKNEATTAEVEKLYGLLQKYHKETECNPICYFEFVLNPSSFSQTVENIFYVSFLLRDGLARIILDDDKLPMIEPLENPEKEKVKKKVQNHQTIVTISPQEWKELIDVYQIDEPLIPTRLIDASGKKRMKMSR